MRCNEWTERLDCTGCRCSCGEEGDGDRDRDAVRVTVRGREHVLAVADIRVGIIRNERVRWVDGEIYLEYS